MFEWSDYLALAEELGTRIDDEPAQRSAISRAYYAVFGLAQERLLDRGWRATDGRPHHRVWGTYQSSPQEACRRIGEIGFVLRDQRNTADYRRPLPPWFVARDEAVAGTGVEPAFLPFRSPELMPLEWMRRGLKVEVAANRCDPSVDELAAPPGPTA